MQLPPLTVTVIVEVVASAGRNVSFVVPPFGSENVASGPVGNGVPGQATTGASNVTSIGDAESKYSTMTLNHGVVAGSSVPQLPRTTVSTLQPG